MTCERDVAHVGFQAPAAHAAERRSVIFDEELGARPAVRGALDSNDRGDRGSSSDGGQLDDTVGNLRRFTPVFHKRLIEVASLNWMDDL